MSETSPELADDRTGPDFMAGDRQSLEQWLEFYRHTLPWKVGGLTPEQLCRRAVPPSNLSLIGIVRHLADVERYWFSNVAAGTDQAAHFRAVDRDADLNDVDPGTALADLGHFGTEIAACRTIAAGVSDLDAALSGLRHGKPINLRWIYTHMIEE